MHLTHFLKSFYICFDFRKYTIQLEFFCWNLLGLYMLCVAIETKQRVCQYLVTKYIAMYSMFGLCIFLEQTKFIAFMTFTLTRT